MRITLLLPHIELTGGIRVAFEYANHLHALGHNVNVIYPRIPLYLRDRADAWRGVRWWQHLFKLEMRYWRSAIFSGNQASWLNVDAPMVRVADLLQEHIPESDIILAVNWKTAELIDSYSLGRGKRFYLIQGYETWYGPKDRVDATWTMPLNKVVVSSSLKELARVRFGQDVYGPVLNGVNFRQFYNPHKIYHEPRRIGMVFNPRPIKGAADGLRAFRLAREEHPDIKLIMFGTSQPGFPLPDWAEFHHNPPQDVLRDLYSACDIWLFPSRREGCGLPPMEAMACQCAVVATNVGAIPDYAVPDETALISPPEDPKALAHNLVRLLDQETLLRDISQAGYRKIQEFSWERAARELESIFIRVRGLTPHD